MMVRIPSTSTQQLLIMEFKDIVLGYLIGITASIIVTLFYIILKKNLTDKK